MKLLKDILYKAGLEEIAGDNNLAIEHISFNTNEIKKNSLFIAIKGLNFDGHNFIDQCINSGAIAIVCEVLPKILKPGITYAKVKNSRSALAYISANFYDNPSSKIKLVGITGTNGKTTCSTLLHQLYTASGYKTGLLSTIEIKIGEKIIPATHTTPDPLNLNRLLNQMIQEGCTHCFMEVSSHAVDQKRVEGLQFAGGAFTNITHDHLDYHKTFDQYLKAKKEFFDKLPSDAFALYNNDDKNGKVMVQNTLASKKTYGVNSICDYKAKILELSLLGLHLSINNSEVWLRYTGKFNAYNSLVAYGVSQLLGMDSEQCLLALSKIKGAQGRFHLVPNNTGKTVVVDYAHTPDALKNVLETIHDIKSDTQKIITVIGCGGNRDKEKRPKMAKISSDYSHRVILTSDNPRDEEPDQIIEDMMRGISKEQALNTLAISNRKEAIKTALTLASEKDIVLVAGKGHEKYQEIKGVKHDFDDVQIIKEILN